MKINQMIKELQAIMEEHGDLEAYYGRHDFAIEGVELIHNNDPDMDFFPKKYVTLIDP